MTTLADKFKEAAQTSVAKYSVGTYEYNFGDTGYDPDTGAVSRTLDSKQFPAARYNITSDKRAQFAYKEETCIVVAAGLDLGEVIPRVGGKVTFPDQTVHRIVWIEPDQYQAAYFMHVTVNAIAA